MSSLRILLFGQLVALAVVLPGSAQAQVTHENRVYLSGVAGPGLVGGELGLTHFMGGDQLSGFGEVAVTSVLVDGWVAILPQVLVGGRYSASKSEWYRPYVLAGIGAAVSQDVLRPMGMAKLGAGIQIALAGSLALDFEAAGKVLGLGSEPFGLGTLSAGLRF